MLNLESEFSLSLVNELNWRRLQSSNHMRAKHLFFFNFLAHDCLVNFTLIWKAKWQFPFWGVWGTMQEIGWVLMWVLYFILHPGGVKLFLKCIMGLDFMQILCKHLKNQPLDYKIADLLTILIRKQSERLLYITVYDFYYEGDDQII